MLNDINNQFNQTQQLINSVNQQQMQYQQILNNCPGKITNDINRIGGMIAPAINSNGWRNR